jgi:hypothetical protein
VARSERLGSILVLTLATTIALISAGCSDLPSKQDALAVVKHSVKEDAMCTLPITLLSRLKAQHSTKAMCVPREGGAPMDSAMACLDALVAIGATKRMGGSYMAEWPDEVGGAGFDTVSPYDRRARALVFKGCVEMTPGIREGQFRCGEAVAEKVVQITKTDDDHARVRYARNIKLNPKLAELDAACGAITRPAPEGSVTFAKTEGKKWELVSEDAPATAGSTSAH